MKKLLSVLLLSLSVIFLVACASGQSLDGNWYEFDSDGYLYSSTPDLVIDGVSGELVGSYTFTVDTTKKEFSAQGHSAAYVLEGDTLSVGGYVYVKEGSKKYKELKELTVKKETDEIIAPLVGQYYQKEKEYAASSTADNNLAFEILGNRIIIEKVDGMPSGEFEIEVFSDGVFIINKQAYYFRTTGSSLTFIETEIVDGKPGDYGTGYYFVKK